MEPELPTIGAFQDAIQKAWSCSAQFSETVPVKGRFADGRELEAMIYVFDTVGMPLSNQAYAWISPVGDGRPFVALAKPMLTVQDVVGLEMSRAYHVGVKLNP